MVKDSYKKGVGEERFWKFSDAIGKINKHITAFRISGTLAASIASVALLTRACQQREDSLRW